MRVTPSTVAILLGLGLALSLVATTAAAQANSCQYSADAMRTSRNAQREMAPRQALGMLTLASSRVWAQGIDPLARLEKLSDAFELARITVDIEAARALVLPDAKALNADGSLPRPLLKRIAYWAERKEKEGPFEPVRVVDRSIMVHGNVAIVTELIGASASIDKGVKIKPRRRTVTWVMSESDWKIAGVHTSLYSTWETSITAYEEMDARSRIAAGSIVFVGSSSVRGWKTLGSDFPDSPVLGRGFGGSQLIDSVMYAHRIVTPYQPSAVAVYAGDNDIAAGKSVDQVFRDFKMLVETIHAADPNIRIGFIAIKPSIKRWNRWPAMQQANDMVAEYAQHHDLVTYLDIATPMLGGDGKPKPELFVEDGLHMSPPGYQLWTSVISPWVRAAKAP